MNRTIALLFVLVGIFFVITSTLPNITKADVILGCDLPIEKFKVGDTCVSSNQNDKGKHFIWKLVNYNSWSGAESWLGPDGLIYQTRKAQPNSKLCAVPNKQDLQKFKYYGGVEIPGLKNPKAVCKSVEESSVTINENAGRSLKRCTEFAPLNPMKINESCKTRNNTTFTLISMENGQKIWKNEKTGEVWSVDSQKYTQYDALKKCQSLGGHIPSVPAFKAADEDGIREILPPPPKPQKGPYWTSSVCPNDSTLGVKFDSGVGFPEDVNSQPQKPCIPSSDSQPTIYQYRNMMSSLICDLPNYTLPAGNDGGKPSQAVK